MHHDFGADNTYYGIKAYEWEYVSDEGITQDELELITDYRGRTDITLGIDWKWQFLYKVYDIL